MRGGVKWVCLPFQCGSQPSEGSRRQRVCRVDRPFDAQDTVSERESFRGFRRRRVLASVSDSFSYAMHGERRRRRHWRRSKREL